MFGDSAFPVSAAGGASGNAVTFAAVADSKCTVSGTTVTLTGAGTCTIVASQAGNANYLAAESVSRTFTVVGYTKKGFYAPVDMTPAGATTKVWNAIKGGNTVPVKFELFRGSLTDVPGVEITSVSAVASLKPVVVNCSTGTTDDIEVLAAGSTALRYDDGSGQFIYNWKTPAGSACYDVAIDVARQGDGTTVSPM